VCSVIPGRVNTPARPLPNLAVPPGKNNLLLTRGNFPESLSTKETGPLSLWPSYCDSDAPAAPATTRLGWPATPYGVHPAPSLVLICVLGSRSWCLARVRDLVSCDSWRNSVLVPPGDLHLFFPSSLRMFLRLALEKLCWCWKQGMNMNPSSCSRSSCAPSKYLIFVVAIFWCLIPNWSAFWDTYVPFISYRV
jgi:hypothetical protein